MRPAFNDTLELIMAMSARERTTRCIETRRHLIRGTALIALSNRDPGLLAMTVWLDCEDGMCRRLWRVVRDVRRTVISRLDMFHHQHPS